MKKALIFLAGGKGLRMGTETPKQFLLLKNQPIALYSWQVLNQMNCFDQMIVVADPLYQSLFPTETQFALPGNRRQDSVYNGFQKIDSSIDLVCIHDAARPFITAEIVCNLLNQAEQVGAATLGMPLKFTVKEAATNEYVKSTLPREALWEIQTPQAIRRDLLQKGFERAHAHNITVTDDVSLVELLSHPVKLVKGSYRNIKITTPEDLQLANAYAL